MKLETNLHDRSANAGESVRRCECVTIRAETAMDTALLAQLVLLLMQEKTTSAGVRALVERPSPELPVP